MNIRVENTIAHRTYVDNELITIQGVVVILALIECTPEEAIFWRQTTDNVQTSRLNRHDYAKQGLVKGIGTYLRPIFALESDKIAPGDEVINISTKHRFIATESDVQRLSTLSSHWTRKVLVDTKEISPLVINLILNGLIKDGRAVVLEARLLGGTGSGYALKLDSENFVIAHPYKEETVPMSEVKRMLSEKDVTKREEYDTLLRSFRSECLPFGEYPDYLIIQFLDNYFKNKQ